MIKMGIILILVIAVALFFVWRSGLSTTVKWVATGLAGFFVVTGLLGGGTKSKEKDKDQSTDIQNTGWMAKKIKIRGMSRRELEQLLAGAN